MTTTAIELNEFGSRIVQDSDGRPLNPEAVDLTATYLVRIKIKAAPVDCTGDQRSDLVEHLRDAIEDSLIHEMPYDDGDRESTDLVQLVENVQVMLVRPARPRV